jgi:hypothetical protein
LSKEEKRRILLKRVLPYLVERPVSLFNSISFPLPWRERTKVRGNPVRGDTGLDEKDRS